MIGVSSSSRSFKSLGRYLVTAKDGPDEERVAWTSARNLPSDDPEIAVKVMRATASQNVRTTQPVYHLALSFDPQDAVDRATMERVADRVLTGLHLRDHQALIVAHGDRRHPHMHLLINRVHPESGKVWDRWRDYPTIQRALREEEQALGLRRVETPQVQLPEQASEPKTFLAIRGDLGTHHRISEAADRCYAAELELSAARAQVQRLDDVARWVDRAENALDEELRRLYRDPASAKQELLAAAEARGPKAAIDSLRNAPEAFGDLRVSEVRSRWGPSQASDASARESAGTAASRAAEFLDARRELSRTLHPSGHARDARVVPRPSIGEARASNAEKARGAEGRLAEIRAEARSLPRRDDVEYRLRQALRRLSPPEFERLRLTLYGHQLAVAYKLRQIVRDAALGRSPDD